MDSNISARKIALGGVLAALAVTIMGLGTLIPVATFLCPALCILLQQLVARLCGSRLAWAWYGAVAILSALLAPDKEAAAVFLFLGYYPIVKPRLDRARLSWLWKGLLFNGAIGVMYWVLIGLLGLPGIGEEFSGMGIAMAAVLLVLGNATFFLLDRLLGRKLGRRR